MKTKKTNFISRAFLAFIMIFPILAGAIGGFSTVAHAAEGDANVTLTKYYFTKDMNPNIVENDGTNKPDWGTTGEVVLGGVEFTVYDVTEDYHKAYKDAFVGETTSDAAKTTALNAVKANTNLTESKKVVGSTKTTGDNGQVNYPTLPKTKTVGTGNDAKTYNAVYVIKETANSGAYIMKDNEKVPVNVEFISDNMVLAFPVFDKDGKELSNPINLFPKNKQLDSEIKITKDSIKYDHKIGVDYEYVVKADVPKDFNSFNADTTPKYKKYIITDTFANEQTMKVAPADYTFKLVPVTPSDTLKEIELATTDYTLTDNQTATPKNVSISLTKEGIAKISTALKGVDLAKVENKYQFVWTYKMFLNKAAAPDKAYYNKATVETDYNKAEAPKVHVATGGYNFIKKDANSDKTLKGAEFYVTDKKEGTINYLKVTFDTTDKNKVTKTEWVATKGEATKYTTEADGKISIYGLDNGTYYLEEVKAPEGYVIPADPFTEFKVETKSVTESEAIKDNEGTGSWTTTAANPLEVLNQLKGFLPSTGGKGIYMFLAVGAVFVAAVGIWFVKTRKEETEA